MLLRFVVWVDERFHGEQGATMVEYGVMVALVAAISIVTIGLLGGQVKTAFCVVVNALPGGPLAC